MQGYWNDDERTAESIDDEGWMHSGDLAVMAEDGYVNIVGRIKDMVIRGGENVYPREVEEFLFTHPDIEDVQVIGVPDERYGEELMAWVRVRRGADVDTESLREFCRGKIAHYKIPRYVKLVDEFPMTVTGKVQKFKMREESMAELGLQPVDDRLIHPSVPVHRSVGRPASAPPTLRLRQTLGWSRTSALCWPSSGTGPGRWIVSSKSTGLAIARQVSPSAPDISTKAPDASTCGSASTVRGLLIGAHHTSCSSKRAAQAAISREAKATSSSATNAAQCSRRVRAVAKRSSAAGRAGRAQRPAPASGDRTRGRAARTRHRQRRRSN